MTKLVDNKYNINFQKEEKFPNITSA